MVDGGDPAPRFTVPMATPENAGARGEYTSAHVERFTLSDVLDDGPTEFAFFPGVYSHPCTEELCQFRDWSGELGDLDAAVYGVSADAPWSQLAFIDEYGLTYPLLSGFNNAVIDDYGLRRERGAARRYRRSRRLRRWRGRDGHLPVGRPGAAGVPGPGRRRGCHRLGDVGRALPPSCGDPVAFYPRGGNR